MTNETKIRQPIITVCGHVDHGKTSLLDAFRGSSVQEGEAGGITQKISFTRFPIEKVHEMCPLIKEKNVDIKIPGFLFIDTPGHAAFTNLRKRGGSLADLAIVVVDIKEGIKPQTAEVLSILKTHKTPFVIALNKIDNLSGWKRRDSMKESIDMLPVNVREEFDTALFTFQGSLHSHGFESSLYYEIEDFKKQVAIVPCSARTGQGISELLFMLCGLCQRFLTEQLTLTEEAKGVILEIKKEKSMEQVEAIIYDGKIDEGDEIAIASFGEPIITKIRAIEEIQPLSFKYKSASSVLAATGLRLRLANTEDILPGMPFEEIRGNLEEIKSRFKKEVSGSIELDSSGIIAKADSLGSLEALLVLLRQAQVSILKASIGPIGKADISAAKAIMQTNELDGVIVGFNVPIEEVDKGNVKIFTHDVVYKLIDDLKLWREKKTKEIEKERLMGLATICKLQILSQYVFRNSNPAIFGVKVLGGKLRVGIPLIDNAGEEIAHVKGIQSDKKSVNEAEAGLEVALSLTGVNFERQLSDKKFLYSNISEMQFKAFKKNKDLLNAQELGVLQELAEIKRRKNGSWGA
ncbi:MAG: translation initiation factor IF-2 [Nanoarchaeota archaeon]